MEKMRVLVVDDDPNIGQLIKLYLEKEGFEPQVVVRGDDALNAFRKNPPHIVLLDLMLPGMDGWQVCREIRKISSIPIIMLTAKDETFDKVLGLELGADDYVTKPFIADELLLRIDAHVRRHRGDIEHARKNSTDVSELVRREPCRIGDLEVFFDRYEVHLHGETVPLTAKEFEILALLAESPGEVFTRRRIYEHLWGETAEVDENSITVSMRKIREKIENNPSEPRYLLTVWRVGYKLAAE